MTATAAVIGGGPAGLAAAIALGHAGWQVDLYDPSYPKVQKACGEGFMPTGIAVLAALGIDAHRIAGQPLRDIAYHDRKRMACGRFPVAVRGIARPALSAALVQRAEAVGVRVHARRVVHIEEDDDGVAVHLGNSAPATGRALRADYLIGADGLHSVARSYLLQGRTIPPVMRFGLRQHFRLSEPGDRIHVWFGADCDAGFIPVGPDLVNVSFLLRRPSVGFAEALREFPQLAEMLRYAEATDSVRGAGPFWQVVPRVASRRVALVGDAAGYVDAITGEGVSVALHTAYLLAQTLIERRPLSHYARAHRRVYGHYARQARLVLWLSRIGWLRRAALILFAWFPSLLHFWVRQATIGSRALWPKPVGLP